MQTPPLPEGWNPQSQSPASAHGNVRPPHHVLQIVAHLEQQPDDVGEGDETAEEEEDGKAG